jgi:hypothetical protein
MLTSAPLLWFPSISFFPSFTIIIIIVDAIGYRVLAIIHPSLAFS